MRQYLAVAAVVLLVLLSWVTFFGAMSFVAPLIGLLPKRAGPTVVSYGGPIQPKDFSVQGTASVTGGGIDLTVLGRNFAAGSAFLTQRIRTTAFRAEFQFRIIPGESGVEASGDGFTFAVAGTPGTVGLAARGLGLDGTPTGGFAVEFDTWNNGAEANDVDGNHVAIDVDGRVVKSVGSPVAVPKPLDDGRPHQAVITYEETSGGGHVTVSIDGTVHLDRTDPAIGVPDGYFGFTGATGGQSAIHRIDSLQLSTSPPKRG